MGNLENAQRQVAKLKQRLRDLDFTEVDTELQIRHDLRIWTMQLKCLESQYNHPTQLELI